MFKNVRTLSIIAILLAVITINVAATQTAVASDTGLPCYDMWQDCLNNSNHTADYCDGVWCGCMAATYSYVCDALIS